MSNEEKVTLKKTFNVADCVLLVVGISIFDVLAYILLLYFNINK